MTDFGQAWILGPALGIIQAYLLRISLGRLGDPGSSLHSEATCRSCGGELGMAAGIPVIGTILHLGKCKHCGTGLSAPFLFFEFAIILITIWLFYTQPLLIAMEASVFALALIGLALADMKYWLIPNGYVLIILFLALMEIVSGTMQLENAIKGMGVGLAVGLLLILPQLQDKGDGGPALGDVKLVLALGLWLGWILAIYVFFLASILALLWWLIEGFRSGLSTKRRLAFGPFVALWALVMGLGKLLDPQFVVHLMSFRI